MGRRAFEYRPDANPWSICGRTNASQRGCSRLKAAIRAATGDLSGTRHAPRASPGRARHIMNTLWDLCPSGVAEYAACKHGVEHLAGKPFRGSWRWSFRQPSRSWQHHARAFRDDVRGQKERPLMSIKERATRGAGSRGSIWAPWRLSYDFVGSVNPSVNRRLAAWPGIIQIAK